MLPTSLKARFNQKAYPVLLVTLMRQSVKPARRCVIYKAPARLFKCFKTNQREIQGGVLAQSFASASVLCNSLYGMRACSTVTLYAMQWIYHTALFREITVHRV